MYYSFAKVVACAVQTTFLHIALEIQVCYRVIWRDIPVVLTGLAFTVTAAKHGHCSLADFMAALPFAVVYFFLYLYSFNLSNQIAGVEEDKVDKPDRPIPSGLLTIQGAKYRWWIVTALYVATGVVIGNVWSCILWIVTFLAYDHGGMDKYWFTKNCISMPLGTLVLGWAAWSIVYGSTWMNQDYTMFTAVMVLYIAATINLQDLRDAEGDSKSGRKTMPIQFGMHTARVIISCSFTIMIFVSYLAIWNQYMYPVTIYKVVYILAEVFMHLYIIIRTLFLDHTYSEFHHTYHFYTKVSALKVMNLISFF